MEIKCYKELPKAAELLRTEIFVNEQGFREEFGEDDKIALHFVGFIKDEPVATCRILPLDGKGEYLLGRMAVKKEMCGMGLGEKIIKFAESHIKSLGAEKIIIHAQMRAVGFYEKCGYEKEGEVFYEENYPHITVVKTKI